MGTITFDQSELGSNCDVGVLNTPCISKNGASF